MPVTVAFDTLSSSQSSLVDLGSVCELLSRESLAFIHNGTPELHLVRERGREVADLLFSKVLYQTLERHSEGMRLLELIVVNDSLVIDEALLDSNLRFPLARNEVDNRRLAEFLDSANAPWFVACRVPEEVRRQAATEINGNLSHCLALKAKRGQRVMFHAGDKIAHDNIFERPDSYKMYCYADSGDSPQRAYYYLSVARSAGIPLVVSPNKQHQLEAISRMVRKSTHKILSEMAIDSPTRAQVADYLEPEEAPMPPIQEMILSHAYYNGISPREACIDLRNSTEAAAYRTLLRTIFVQRGGDLAARNAADNELVKIKARMQQWRAAPGSGRHWTRAQFNLGKLPCAGWLAEMTGTFRNIQVPTPLLFQNPAYVFMSRWFRSGRRQTA